MGRELFVLGVVVDEPVSVARRYAAMLAMRPLAMDAQRGDVVVMAGADSYPFIVLVRRSAPGLAEKLDGLPPGRGVRMLMCFSDEFDSDCARLSTSHHGEWQTVGRDRPERCCSVRLDSLGLLFELVERRAETSLDVAARIAGCLAAPGASLVTDATSEVFASISSSSAVASLANAPLDHMAIGVLDVAGATDIVQTAIGCRFYDEMPVESAAGRADLKLYAHEPPEGFTLVLGHVDDSSPNAPQHPFRRVIAERGGPGVHHVAHRVNHLDVAVAEVKAAGGTLLSPIEEAAGLRQIFVSVADDALIHELVERTGVTGFITSNTAGLVRAEAEWNR